MKSLDWIVIGVVEAVLVVWILDGVVVVVVRLVKKVDFWVVAVEGEVVKDAVVVVVAVVTLVVSTVVVIRVVVVFTVVKVVVEKVVVNFVVWSVVGLANVVVAVAKVVSFVVCTVVFEFVQFVQFQPDGHEVKHYLNKDNNNLNQNSSKFKKIWVTFYQH